MTGVVEQPAKQRVKRETMAAAINRTLDAALAADPTVILLGEDIADPAGGVMTVTNGLSTKYGVERVRATPISEQAFLGAAIGASMAGYRPVVEIMLMDFLLVCMDQLVNHAAKLRFMSGGRTSVPITVRTVVTGGAGFGAQHSQALEGLLMQTPGIKIAIPSTPAEAAGLLASCIADDDPCLFVEPMSLLFASAPAEPDAAPVPLGKAAVKREGTDVTLITWGTQVPNALAAAEELAGEGVSAEVLDLRTLVPLDREALLTSVAKTRRALVVHSAVEFAGPGAEIASLLHTELWGQLERPVGRLGAPYAPVPYSPVLEQAYLPGPASIAAAVRGL